MTTPRPITKPSPKTVATRKKREIDLNERLRQSSTQSNIRAGILHETFTGNMMEGVNMLDVAVELSESSKRIKSGDFSEIDSMYLSQAKSLEWLFVSLARKASFAEQLPQYQTFMNLALKAQSQSRATLQALVDRHNPKQVAFVKQANIAGGHQQINNGNNEVGKISAKPSKLLTEDIYDGQNLDVRATPSTEPSYQAVEAMGEINGRKNG